MWCAGLGGPDSAIPSNEILTSTIVGYNNENPYPTPEDKGDPEKAKTLLAEAGETESECQRGLPHHPEFEKIATSVQAAATPEPESTSQLTPIPGDGWGAFSSFLGR